MKKIEIKICSTSYLIPTNKNWDKVSKISELSFSEYSDWMNFFSNSRENEVLISIIFFQDIYDNFKKKNDEKNFFDFYFKILIDRLKFKKSRVVICVSGYVDSNILKFDKNYNTNSFYLSNLFKKNFITSSFI